MKKACILITMFDLVHPKPLSPINFLLPHPFIQLLACLNKIILVLYNWWSTCQPFNPLLKSFNLFCLRLSFRCPPSPQIRATSSYFQPDRFQSQLTTNTVFPCILDHLSTVIPQQPRLFKFEAKFPSNIPSLSYMVLENQR